MYSPAHFAESRPEVLHELIAAHPFGLLITRDDGAGLQANGLPFVLDAGPAGSLGVLRSHVARANTVWRRADSGGPADGAAEVLVVFQGPQAYVSPGWYASKAEHGKVVPTWNYVMVQARGHLRAVEGTAWLHAFVSRLTDRHEATQAAPWAVGDAPAPFIDSMLGAIVGIEIELTALTGKWKVSQNRSAADREGVARGLKAASRTLAGNEAGTEAPLADLVWPPASRKAVPPA